MGVPLLRLGHTSQRRPIGDVYWMALLRYPLASVLPRSHPHPWSAHLPDGPTHHPSPSRDDRREAEVNQRGGETNGTDGVGRRSTRWSSSDITHRPPPLPSLCMYSNIYVLYMYVYM